MQGNEIMAVWSINRPTLCGQNIKFSNAKAGGTDGKHCAEEKREQKYKIRIPCLINERKTKQNKDAGFRIIHWNVSLSMELYFFPSVSQK